MKKSKLEWNDKKNSRIFFVNDHSANLSDES